MKVIQSFLLAVMWFTRIPVPMRIPNADRLQQQSLAWLPAIGLLIGGLGYGVMYFAQAWGVSIASLVAVGLMLALSGALHEDGWADGWDALGSGSDAEKRLQVLKDPRLGTFGVIALVFSIGIQVLTLMKLQELQWLVLFPVLHAVSRYPLALLAWKLPYVRRDGEGKAGFLHQKPAWWDWVFWMLWIPFFVLCAQAWPLQWWIACGISIMVTMLAVIPWKRSLGGVTGDVFGFCQQAGLLAGLLVATWRVS